VSTTITTLHAGDRDRWAALWRGYLTFYETAVPEAIYASTWSRILDPQGEIHAFGARDDAGELVGITHYLFHPHAWSTREACYLQDLFVDEAARGRGHARALIDAVATVASRRDCHSLYWKTMAPNATARRLYDRVATHDGTIVYYYPLRSSDRGATTRG
jgi:GNAT superfamily N-acetyltransferase